MELQNDFGDLSYIVNARFSKSKIRRLQLKQSFSCFICIILKQLVLDFQNLGFQADVHYTDLQVINTKILDNLLLKWNEYAVRENVKNNNVERF